MGTISRSNHSNPEIQLDISGQDSYLDIGHNVRIKLEANDTFPWRINLLCPTRICRWVLCSQLNFARDQDPTKPRGVIFHLRFGHPFSHSPKASPLISIPPGCESLNFIGNPTNSQTVFFPDGPYSGDCHLPIQGLHFLLTTTRYTHYTPSQGLTALTNSRSLSTYHLFFHMVCSMRGK